MAAYVVPRIRLATKEQVAMAMCLIDDGLPFSSVAGAVGCSNSTLSYTLWRARRWGFAAWEDKQIAGE